MIEDASSVPNGSLLEFDLCIVGGGPAGITIAREFANRSRRVLLLEGGGWKETPEARDLLRGHVYPPGSHEDLATERRRQFGGCSVAWGGRCVPLDEIDFEARPWVKNSGWPITYGEYKSFLARAAEVCEVGRAAFDAREIFSEAEAELMADFDAGSVSSTLLERWSPPTNFARRYESDLRRSSNVTVLLGANVTNLAFDPSGRRVRYANVAVSPTHRFRVGAKCFVLACGGLENARVLLASREADKERVGACFDSVGRFYMSHVEGIFSTLRFRDENVRFKYEFESDDGVYIRRRIWITGETQQDERIGNSIACFSTPFHHETVSDYPLASVIKLAKLGRSIRRTKGAERREFIASNRREISHLVRNLVLRAPILIPQVSEIVKQRYFSSRRMPILLPPRQVLKNRYALYVQSEHLPNPESRVILHPSSDALGVQRLEVRVAFKDDDVRTVLRTHEIIGKRLAESGIGSLSYDPKELEESVRSGLSTFYSMAHHIGTTRMSGDSSDGVVDRNCRVHGFQNMFVAGASVFSTAGHANPTLSIVALALRLSDHLVESDALH